MDGLQQLRRCDPQGYRAVPAFLRLPLGPLHALWGDAVVGVTRREQAQQGAMLQHLNRRQQ